MPAQPPRNRTATQDRVRAAAVELFASRGFHGTGIRDLAERAELASATLYHYMGTKQDLLATIMRDSLGHLLDAAEHALTRAGPDPTAQLCALVRMHVREHALLRAETSVVDGEIAALDAARRAEIVALRDRYEEHWERVIAAGVRARHFCVPDQRLARIALLEMCSGVSRWYRPDGELGLEDVTDRFVALACALVRADRAA